MHTIGMINDIVEKYGSQDIDFLDNPNVIKYAKVGKLDSNQKTFYRAFLILEDLQEKEEVLADFNFNRDYLAKTIVAIGAIFDALFAYNFNSQLPIGCNYYIDKDFDVYIAVDNIPN